MREPLRRLLACICLAACCPCCFPCYICAIRSRKRRREQEEYEAIMEYQRVGPRSPDTVHPLRRGYRRRISIPSGMRKQVDDKSSGANDEKSIEIINEDNATHEASVGEKGNQEIAVRPSKVNLDEQTTHAQLQSLLFQKLPPEIRSLIWRQCVGHYNIYIGVISDEKRIRHCKIFEGKGLMRMSMDQEEQDKLMRDHYFISLLQSCRRIYTEAIGLLYNSNTFLLSTPKTLLALSSTTLLHRFNSITSLSIKYTPQLQHGLSFGLSQHDVRIWQRTSDLLASMKGLRSLDIVLWDRSLYGTPGEWDNLERLLRMLGKIRHCKHFAVTLDQNNEVEGLRDRLGEVPFFLKFGRGDDGERFFWLL